MAVAGAPAAHADAVNALVYGQFNVSLDVVTATAPDRDPPSTTHLSSNASRFGLRGAEYVGGGLLASWQIESGFNADSGGGGLAVRETYVALEGDWGRVKLGNFLTPYDDVLPIFGNVTTLTTSILSTAALWAQGGVPKANGGFDRRMPNSLRYDSPDVEGLQASLQYALAEDDRDAGVLGAGITLVRGPLEAGIAYEYNRAVRGADLDDHAVTATASWNFGAARVAGVYEYLRYRTFDGPLSRDLFGASVTIPVATGALYAFAGRAREGRGSSQVRVGGLTGGDDSGAWQYTLTYSHSLSPRTMLYAGIVGLENERNASYTFAINPYTQDSPTGLKLRGLVLGAVHFF
ncbi:MAG: outer membrane porin protein [Betaproteobacteria bacterium]|nr:MAG: outer membrane porin protein [Betaproteobacteria bacterium]